MRVYNIDTLIVKVKTAYQEYYPEALDHIWGHLYQVYNSLFPQIGGNLEKVLTGVRKYGKYRDSAINLDIHLG